MAARALRDVAHDVVTARDHGAVEGGDHGRLGHLEPQVLTGGHVDGEGCDPERQRYRQSQADSLGCAHRAEDKSPARCPQLREPCHLPLRGGRPSSARQPRHDRLSAFEALTDRVQVGQPLQVLRLVQAQRDDQVGGVGNQDRPPC